MQEQIKEAFDEIVASEARITKTQRAVLASMRTPQKKSSPFKRWSAVAVAMACLLFASTSVMLYFTTTAVVSVDINPSLELEINRFDRVVDVNGYNSDGEVLAKTVDLTHKSIDDAMVELLESDAMQGYIANDGDLTIAVVSTKESAQGEALLEVVTRCTQTHKNAHCYTMNNGAHHEAHAVGLSCGRYHAYEALVQAGVAITPEEMNAMSMKDINALVAEYGATEGGGGCAQGHGHHGHHHGCE